MCMCFIAVIKQEILHAQSHCGLLPLYKNSFSIILFIYGKSMNLSSLDPNRPKIFTVHILSEFFVFKIRGID